MRGYYDDIVNLRSCMILWMYRSRIFIRNDIKTGFSIATIGKPDILIVDEVLAVGDSKFQQKCIDRIQEMMSQGTTVLFVSHSIEQVKLVCKKVVWLEHGKLKAYGDALEICEQYENMYGGR